MNQILTKLEHVGTDVLEDEVVYVLIPGQYPIKSQVIGVFDGMVFLEHDDEVMSWVNAEHIYSNA